MNKEEIFTAVFAFITVVNAACDRNAATECLTNLQTAQGNAGDDIGAQCSAFETFKTCLNPYREACQGDALWPAISQMETSLSQLCGGSGCQIASCMMLVQKYQPSGETGNQQIEASPEMCAAVKEFKKCVEAAKPNCDADDQTLTGAELMISSYETICSGCSPSKMQTCVTHIGSLVSEEFKGFPTTMQINTACPKMEQFNTCINPVRTACAAVGNEQGKQITSGIDSAMQLTDLICGDQFKNDFIKYGNECFDKNPYKDATKMCESKAAPPSGASSEPEPESKEEMCKRITDDFNCFMTKTEEVCSEDAFKFAKQVEGRFLSSIAGNLGCAVSGAPRMSVQIWLFVSVLLAAVFLS